MEKIVKKVQVEDFENFFNSHIPDAGIESVIAMSTMHCLANNLNIKTFLDVTHLINKMKTNLFNLIILAAISPDKECYHTQKEIFLKEVKNFFEHHDKILEDMLNKNNEQNKDLH